MSAPRAFRRASGRASLRALAVGVAVALVGMLAVVTLSSGAGGVTGAAALDAPRPGRPGEQTRPRARASAAARAPAAPTTISFFGDSLAHEAKAAYLGQLARRSQSSRTIGTYPMTALCDYRDEIALDLFAHRPDLLVLEFSGNSATPCMRDAVGSLPAVGSTRSLTHYLDDLHEVLTIANATRTKVIWATAPPLSPAQFSSNYPRTLAGAIRKLAASSPDLRVVETGAALTTDGRTFARTLPCRPDEAAYCTNGRVIARSDDGLHFDCHGFKGPLGVCIGYSAGARRFGEAIADAAADAR